jgi:hypothetical protein
MENSNSTGIATSNNSSEMEARKNNTLNVAKYKLFVDMLFGEYLYALNCQIFYKYVKPIMISPKKFAKINLNDKAAIKAFEFINENINVTYQN